MTPSDGEEVTDRSTLLLGPSADFANVRQHRDRTVMPRVAWVGP